MQKLSRPEGFILYDNMGVDFFSTSELLHPNMKIRLWLIRARPKFYMISDNPNVSLGIVDCSLSTRLIAPNDDYHKKRLDMLAYTPVEFNNSEPLAKSLIISARQNQFIQENTFNNSAVRRNAIAMNTNTEFTSGYKEKFSGMNNLISNKLEYSEKVNQLSILMFLIFVAFMLRQWKQWTFKMILPQFRLIISKTTMYWCLIWLRCKMLREIVITQK